MSKMTVSQQFMLRDDLREARKRMTIEEFRAVLKIIDAFDTETEQLKELAKLGKPFYKPPKGRWTTDYTRGDSKFWCPHGLTCMTEDECHDFQEHLEAKGRD